MSLNGASLDLLVSFKKGHGDKTVERFFSVLRNVIRPSRRPIEKLICLRQEAGEDCRAIGMRMLSVADRAFPQMSGEEFDKTCLTYFKQKISEAARAFLAHHKPKTFLRAIKLVSEYEMQRQKGRQAQAVDLLNSANNSPSVAPRLVKNQTGVKEMAEQLTSMQERLDRFEAIVEPVKRRNEKTGSSIKLYFL